MTNHAEFIRNANEVTVRWTEAECMTDENVTMSLREFRGLLLEIQEEHAAEYGADSLCYCKVAFLAGGKSFRIDVNNQPGAIDLTSAWIY